ncbi:MAG: 16S rRNA (cytosine(1402)-N(4))-methyltransferase RsmH [Clostridia bacterium]
MEEKIHKRRERYKGTHPRKFNEKYKELNPEKYADTIEKIIQKGNTPAGMHISIMVPEIIEFLQIKPGQKGLDGTLGYGGHTSHMLRELQGDGHMYGLDIDPIEIVKTRERLKNLGFDEDILTILHQNFETIDQVAQKYGPFDFILADLGVSSMQIDNPERGFTFKRDGMLDLRLNPEEGVSASERLLTITQPELEGMLVENSDEPFAYEISKAVVRSIKKGTPVDTTQKLREIISDVVSNALRNEPAKARAEAVKKSCQRTFQALRIDVNNEYEVLYSFLEKLPDALAPGGRVAILTFHSGEDRLVKKSFKELSRAGIYSEVARDVVRPSDEECKQNARARSTKMRWAIKA